MAEINKYYLSKVAKKQCKSFFVLGRFFIAIILQ